MENYNIKDLMSNHAEEIRFLLNDLMNNKYRASEFVMKLENILESDLNQISFINGCRAMVILEAVHISIAICAQFAEKQDKGVTIQ